MDDIDDIRLRYELESRGQSVGPIVDTTRNLYKKILKRLIDKELGTIEDIEDDDDNDLVYEEDMSDSEMNSVKPSVKEKSGAQSEPKPRSQLFLFLITLILCIIFAYYIKKF